MKAKTGLIIIGTLLWLVSSVWAQPSGMGMRPQRPMGPGMHQHQGFGQSGLPEGLSSEQKEQIRELIQDMRSAGASRQEIKTAVADLLREWGFEPLAGPKGRPGWMAQLSEEQRQQVRSLIEELKADGATREEIHVAVTEMLSEWGIEAPERPRQNRRPQLSEDQRQALRELRESMKEQGKSRQEIHQAVIELFESWGIEPPEKPGRPHNSMWKDMLDEAQKQEIKALIESLEEQGATRPEIKKAVLDRLNEWGIEMPEHFMQGPGAQLSEEQREQLHALVSGLREQGKSRKEIHAEVAELFESWGLEAPQRPKRPGRAGTPQMPLHQLDLTDEQRTELRETIRTLRQSGASRVEIRNAVHALLEEWGVTPESLGPENPSMLDDKKPVDAKNYPNPFNPSTQITYTIRQEGPVQIQVYNIQGQLIRTLLDEYRLAGTHHVNWDGLDQKGVRVASGTYLYRINTNGHTLTQQMTLTK